MVTYNLIILRVSPQGLLSATQKFAEIFSLEIEPAEQILRGAPIVFLTDLSREYLRTLREQLLTLSKMGIEFMLSTRLSTTIPRVVWPIKKPQYLESSGELIRYVDFQWRGNAFICPNCAETFIFRRLGNPLARYLKVKEEMAIAAKTTIPQEKITPSVSISAEKPKEQPVELDESDVVELAPLTDAQLDNPSESVVELIPVEERKFSSEDLEPIDILETPKEPDVPEAVPEEVAEAELAPAPSASCSVFITFLPPHKKTTAIQLITEIKGVSVKEAQALISKPVVPILKDVTEAEANKCLEEFQKVGIKGKIVKK
jgi:ribosomal protein L7/L12